MRLHLLSIGLAILNTADRRIRASEVNKFMDGDEVKDVEMVETEDEMRLGGIDDTDDKIRMYSSTFYNRDFIFHAWLT